MRPLLAAGIEHALQRVILRLAAAAGEADLLRLAAEKSRDPDPCFVYHLSGGKAEPVAVRGIAVPRLQGMAYDVCAFWRDRGVDVEVEANVACSRAACESAPKAAPQSKGSKYMTLQQDFRPGWSHYRRRS